LICLWADQYREGLLTHDEFKTLVVGRFAVMYMRHLYERSIGMYDLAKKAIHEEDRLLMYREIELGIRKPISLAPAKFSFLC
jgi:hypothetical protein